MMVIVVAQPLCCKLTVRRNVTQRHWASNMCNH